MSEYVITTLGGLKVYNDFNDVTMAHEDDTQVGQSRSSSHYAIIQPKINTKFKQKVKVKLNRQLKKTGVKLDPKL